MVLETNVYRLCVVRPCMIPSLLLLMLAVISLGLEVGLVTTHLSLYNSCYVFLKEATDGQVALNNVATEKNKLI